MSRYCGGHNGRTGVSWSEVTTRLLTIGGREEKLGIADGVGEANLHVNVDVEGDFGFS